MPVRIHMVPVQKNTSSRNSGISRKWWKNERDASIVIYEYIKIAYYFSIRGRI
jgi:hypothetical protein